MRHSQSFAVFALTLVSTAACTATDDVGSSEQDYTVTPTAGSAKLVVLAPPAGGSGEVFVAPRDAQGRANTNKARRVTYGTPLAVSPGKQCVYVALDRQPVAEDCTIVVGSNKLVTYTLGSLLLTRSRNDYLLSIDGEPYPSPVLAARSRVVLPAGTHGYRALYPTWSFEDENERNFGKRDVIEEFAFTIAEGQDRTVDLSTYNETKRGLRFVPHRGTLPQAMDDSFLFSFGAYEPKMPWPTLNSPEPLLLRLDTPYAVKFRGETFTPGAPGTTTDVRLGWIETADVEVTMPDGSKREVRGTWSVTKKGSGLVVAEDVSTGVGLDVLPGSYEVTVTYAHPVDGATQSDTRDVVVP